MKIQNAIIITDEASILEMSLAELENFAGNTIIPCSKLPENFVAALGFAAGRLIEDAATLETEDAVTLEIKITPEMIEAGSDEFCAYDSRYDSMFGEDTVKAIFLAMARKIKVCPR